MAIIPIGTLVQLFSKCRQLRKLSLEHVPINDAVCKALALNRKLEVLNLAMCTGITTYGIRKLLNSLKWYQTAIGFAIPTIKFLKLQFFLFSFAFQFAHIKYLMDISGI